MIPYHKGGFSKPIVMRVVQLFFTFACFAISITCAIGFIDNASGIAATVFSVIAMIDASIGWRAITSVQPWKRNTLLFCDFAGLVALVAALIALILGFAVDELWLVILQGPAAFTALVSIVVLVWQLVWMVPATTKQMDGLIRYSAIQGRKQDIELEAA